MSAGIRCLLIAAGVCAWSSLLSSRSAVAQYSTVTSPFQNGSDGFFEHIGIGWGFSIGNNLMFNNGGGVNAALPQFGGHNPANDATFGFQTQGNGGSAFFNFAFGQGNDRSFTSTAPSITLSNGGFGTISDVTQRPFVTSLVPGVGVMPVPVGGLAVPGFQPVSPLQERLSRLQQEGGIPNATSGPPAAVADVRGGVPAQPVVLGGGGGPLRAAESSATHGDLSVAEIRRRQAAEEEAHDAEIEALVEKGRGAEAAGKPKVAKIYYNMAANRARGSLRAELLAKVAELETAP